MPSWTHNLNVLCHYNFELILLHQLSLDNFMGILYEIRKWLRDEIENLKMNVCGECV